MSPFVLFLLLAPPPYALDAPDGTAELPEALTELSDLTAAGGDALWAVDDEQGALFRVDAKTGAVLETLPFAAAGDFEAVASAGALVFAARSDGAVFAVDPKTGKAETLASSLPRDCDVEGLAHDPAGNRLLASCRRPVGSKAERRWPLYALDLATRKVPAAPVLSVSRAAIAELRKRQPASGLKHADDDLDPSALAVHPTTGQLWLLSARGHVLVVLSRDGAPLSLTALPPERFPQPEAIAFLPDGTLVIGSEARRGGPARLYRFTARRAPP